MNKGLGLAGIGLAGVGLIYLLTRKKAAPSVLTQTSYENIGLPPDVAAAAAAAAATAAQAWYVNMGLSPEAAAAQVVAMAQAAPILTNEWYESMGVSEAVATAYVTRDAAQAAYNTTAEALQAAVGWTSESPSYEDPVYYSPEAVKVGAAAIIANNQLYITEAREALAASPLTSPEFILANIANAEARIAEQEAAIADPQAYIASGATLYSPETIAFVNETYGGSFVAWAKDRGDTTSVEVLTAMGMP